MNSTEQSCVLFFKLYLLAHKANYINYMRGARQLTRLFVKAFERHEDIDITQPTICLCGSCLSIIHKEHPALITFTCGNCNGAGNMGYELGQLATITHIPYLTCIYLLCRAVEDIYKWRNDVLVTRYLNY